MRIAAPRPAPRSPPPPPRAKRRGRSSRPASAPGSSRPTSQTDGTTLVGLELDMPQNTKTYWRIPGETGIADRARFHRLDRRRRHARSSGPIPTVDHVQGYLDYVYYGPTVLPVELDASTATRRSSTLAVTLGVCSDICVPAHGQLLAAARLRQAPTRGRASASTRRWPDVPIAWERTGDADRRRRARCRRRRASPIALGDPSVDPASLIADTGDPGYPLRHAAKKPGWTLSLSAVAGRMATARVSGGSRSASPS